VPSDIDLGEAFKGAERLRQTLETVADGFVDQVELTATWLSVRRGEVSGCAHLVQPESGITLPTIIPTDRPGASAGAVAALRVSADITGIRTAMDNQTIVVTQKNEGCLSGCGTAIGVLLLIGLAVQYWYVALPLAVIGVVAAVWYHSSRREQMPATAPAPAAPPGPVLGALSAGRCPRCEQHSSGNFCEHCGSARGRTCAGCDRHGLDSPFCPHCGAATFVPPT
jgi:hypothetical protein